MMKRFLVCLAVLALASTAFGKGLIVIPPIAGGTNSVAYSISSDGMYVAGSSYGTVTSGTTDYTGDWGIYWSMSMGTDYDARIRYSRFIGVDVASDGKLYGGQRTTDGVASFGEDMHLVTSPRNTLLDSGGAASNVSCASSEASPVAIDASPNAGFTGDAWMGGHDTKKYQAYIYNFQQGTTPGTVYGYLVSSTGTGNGRLTISSLSKYSAYNWSSYTNVPLLAGRDRGGTGGTDRAIWSHVKPGGGTSTTKAIPGIVGAEIDKSNAYGISKDGMWMCGYAYKWTSALYMGFRYNWSGNGTGGAMEELWPVGMDGTEAGMAGYAANVADVATDGTALGWSYVSGQYPGSSNLGVRSYGAAIWLPGSSTGTLLADWLTTSGANLSNWQWLERGEGIEKIGLYKYAITGWGWTNDGQLRGFYIVIPEPATMAFLALGGLALLRRR